MPHILTPVLGYHTFNTITSKPLTSRGLRTSCQSLSQSKGSSILIWDVLPNRTHCRVWDDLPSKYHRPPCGPFISNLPGTSFHPSPTLERLGYLEALVTTYFDGIPISRLHQASRPSSISGGAPPGRQPAISDPAAARSMRAMASTYPDSYGLAHLADFASSQAVL